jgi:6-methylsalicylate decarboxylase
MTTHDLHQHLWPEPFIERLSARDRPPFLRDSVLVTTEGSFPVDLTQHRLDRRLEALDTAEIDVAVVSLQPTLGFEALPASEREPLVAAHNDGIAELVAASGGRIRALAACEFRPELAGVCLGASQLTDLDGLGHILDPLERSGGFLFVHPDSGSAMPSRPDWWLAVVHYTARMQTAYLAWIDRGALRWPELPVVFALLAGGGPFQLDRLRSRGVETQHLTSLPAFFETSSYGRISLELCLATYGVDRLVYGSDFPVLDPAPTMSAIHALGKATSHAICDRNPGSLLH